MLFFGMSPVVIARDVAAGKATDLVAAAMRQRIAAAGYAAAAARPTPAAPPKRAPAPVVALTPAQRRARLAVVEGELSRDASARLRALAAMPAPPIQIEPDGRVPWRDCGRFVPPSR